MIKPNIENVKVDIIVPNYNKGIYLDECLSSVINQTHKNWFLYLIDDCSKDNSLQVIEKYENIQNISVIKLNKNKGPSFCRNLGIRLSNSNFVSFLDSDDAWVKNKLFDQVAFMVNKNFDFTYSDYTIIYDNKLNSKKLDTTNIVENLNYKEFILNTSINSSTMILNRKLTKLVKFKKLPLLEDYLYKCEILRKGHVARKIAQNLAFYRINKNARSNNKLNNLFVLWNINKKFNKLSIIQNIKSCVYVAINSFKKYGIKK